MDQNLTHYIAWRLDALRNARLGYVELPPGHAEVIRAKVRELLREALARGIPLENQFGLM